jgi:hypothetical protein
MLRGESWKINHNLEWERIRYLSSICKNAGIIARGGKVSKSDLALPTDLFKLPQDSLWVRIKDKPKSTLKSFKDFYDRVKQSGFKFDKERDFEKLKEDYR